MCADTLRLAHASEEASRTLESKDWVFLVGFSRVFYFFIFFSPRFLRGVSKVFPGFLCFFKDFLLSPGPF